MTGTHGTSSGPSTLTCEQARRLLERMAVDDRTTTLNEDDAFALHIADCPQCAKAFYVAEGMNEDGSFRPEDEARYAEIEPSLLPPAEGWQNLLWRCPDLAEAYDREKRTERLRPVFRHLGYLAAMAACLAIVAVGGWLLSGRFKPASPVVKQGDAESLATAGRQAPVAGRSATPVDYDMSTLSQDFWRGPALPDPDTLEYAAWRDEYQAWCDRQMPWIAKAGAFLATRNIKADWIDLLMFSGDIWQFHHDPRLPSGQPLAQIEPTAIARLARHYRVDQRELLQAVGLADSTPVATLPADGRTPAQQYAAALRRWHDTVSTAGSAKSPAGGDLVAFSLRASQYLANTRTTAYLWAKSHPQEARQLLADSAYAGMVPAPNPAADKDWQMKQLRQQAVAAQSCGPVAMEWLMIPAAADNGCLPQAAQQQRKLAALADELIPGLSVSPDRRSEGKGQ